MWLAKQGARDGQSLLLSAGDLHSHFADDRVEPAVRALQQVLRCCLVQHSETLGVRGGGTNEQKVLTDGAREQLRILGDEPDPLAEAVEIHSRALDAVVEDLPFFRRVE